MSFPRRCPEYGATFPVTYDRCRDGDTLVVRASALSRPLVVRLKGTWCHELNTPTGVAAEQHADKLLKKPSDYPLVLHIPLPESGSLLDVFSFDRILGYLFLSPRKTLNEKMVEAGLASSTKGGELGQ